MLKRVVILFVILFSAETIFSATEDGKTLIIETSQNQEVTIPLNEFSETVVIRIIDNKGNVIYKEIYCSNGTSRALHDFSAIEPGEYVLNIKTREKEVTRVIYLDDTYQISYEDTL